MTESSPANVLVTGGGGFLGRYIVEQLVARGDRIRSFSRGAYPELDELGVETIQGDIRDEESVAAACEAMDVVFHTAAIAGIGGRWDDFYEINIAGTENLLEGCLKHGVRKFVYTSSPSVTFDGSDQKGVDETASYPTRWMCHYPRSKSLAEQIVLAVNDSDGLMTCALRPHLIWGPRDQHLIPRLIQRARDGKLRRVGDGSNLVDMVYVENAATAHLQAADAMEPGSPIGGSAYFISQGESVNCWDWINDILNLADLEPVTKSISWNAAWLAGALFETIYAIMEWESEPRMTRFLAAQLATSHYFDITRAREDFGYHPQISIEEGMRRLGAELAACRL